MWSLITGDNGEVKGISMTKGDTASFTINCNVTNESGEVVPYEPVDGDEIIFAVKQNKSDYDYLFKIPVDLDTMTVTFSEDDTKDLDLGKYIFEVSLNRTNYHCTFICNKTLLLTVEVY